MTTNLVKAKLNFCLLTIVLTGAFLAPLFCFGQEKALLITQVQIAGEETNQDFIEIYNPQETELNLDDYKLRKRSKTGTEYSIKSFSADALIPANGYFLWACSKEGYDQSIEADVSTTQTLAKNNSIAIVDTEANIIDALAWGESLENPFVLGSVFSTNPEASQSLQRKQNDDATYQDTNNNADDFEINTAPQPKNSSYQTEGALPEGEPAPESPPPSGKISWELIPEAGPDVFALVGQEIQFDGSHSFTSAYITLSYFWNFGDGATSEAKKPTHIYQFPGQYIVSLTVSDGRSTKSDTLSANIYQEGVVINEFLPALEESSWIELFNTSEEMIDLSGWQLKNGTQKKQTFIFPSGSLIAPKQFLVLIEPITKIKLTIADDFLQLIYPNRAIAQEIKYKEAKSGWSANRISNENYIWSASPSPGLTNLITTLPLTEQEFSQQFNGLKIINQASVSQAESESISLVQNSPLIVQETRAEDLTPVSEWPPAPTVEAPEQTEPTATSTNEEQTLLAGISATKAKKTKTAKTILILCIALSFALLASWAMLMLKKALKR